MSETVRTIANKFWRHLLILIFVMGVFAKSALRELYLGFGGKIFFKVFMSETVIASAKMSERHL